MQTKRHMKRTKESPGGIISVESPLHYTNVQLVDPVTNSPVRVCWRYLEDGTKVREPCKGLAPLLSAATDAACFTPAASTCRCD